MDAVDSRGRETASVLYLCWEFPALTQTFVSGEFLALRGLGVDARAMAIVRPDPSCLTEELKALSEVTDYIGRIGAVSAILALAGTLVSHPLRLIRCLRLALGPVRPPRLRMNVLYHLALACRICQVRDLAGVDLIHAHFASSPATIAMFVSVLSGTPYSVTAHAYDLFAEEVLLPQKLGTASLFVTISEYARGELLRRFGDLAASVEVVRCGVLPQERIQTAEEESPPLLLSVGSLNQKKGHDTLIEACSLLCDRGVDFRCSIVGGGYWRSGLEALIAARGLEDRVRLEGPQPQNVTRRMLERATVSVLACRDGRNGDIDGIPVALMEAMAAGVPVVSTWLAGIPELITHDVDGLLVPARRAGLLADALELLLRDEPLRRRLAMSACQKVQRSYDLSTNVGHLASLMHAVTEPAKEDCA